VVEVKHSKNTILSNANADADRSINNTNETIKILVLVRIVSSLFILNYLIGGLIFKVK